MQSQGSKNFAGELEKSKNVGVVANADFALDALCAAVGLSELIKVFLESLEDYVVSVYYLENLPHGADIITDKVKIFNKIGEKTLYIRFPSKGVEKVQYDLDETKKRFQLSLVGFKGSIKNKKAVEMKEEREHFDMLVGVGFKDEEEFFKKVPYAKKADKTFVFNKENLEGISLTEGVIDLFFKEKVKPSHNASLAFFTALSFQETADLSDSQ